jgi:hypothetical protein
MGEPPVHTKYDLTTHTCNGKPRTRPYQPRQRNHPYQCPRCGMETPHKAIMRYHLFQRKRTDTCPSILSNIILTNEIKEHIIKYRKWMPLAAHGDNKIVNQTINNYNVMQNFIAEIDIVEKLKHLAEYKGIAITDFPEQVQDMYAKTTRRLQLGNLKHHFLLERNDFINTLDLLTKRAETTMECMNFIYDHKRNRVRVFQNEQWEDFLVEQGLNYLVQTIADYYLEAYECYLIRKLYAYDNNVDTHDRITPAEYTRYEQCLREYYQFIGTFDVEPHVKNKNDNEILYPDNDKRHFLDGGENSLSHKYMRVYDNVILTIALRKNLQKKVLDILKTNAQDSIKDINKSIMGIINMDEEFKRNVVQLRSG